MVQTDHICYHWLFYAFQGILYISIRPDSIDLLFLSCFLGPFQNAEKYKIENKKKPKQEKMHKKAKNTCILGAVHKYQHFHECIIHFLRPPSIKKEYTSTFCECQKSP